MRIWSLRSSSATTKKLRPPSASTRVTRRMTGTVTPPRRRTSVSDSICSAVPARTSSQTDVFGRRGQFERRAADQLRRRQAEQQRRGLVDGDDADVVRIDEPDRVGHRIDQRAPAAERRRVEYGRAGFAFHAASSRARGLEEVGHARARREVVEGRARQLLRPDAAPDAEAGDRVQIDDERLFARDLGIVHEHARLQRPGRVHGHDHRVAVIRQLHRRAGRIGRPSS